MGSEWPTCSLKEAGVQLIDCDHKTPKAQEIGFPYIGIPQMKEGNIDFDANPRPHLQKSQGGRDARAPLHEGIH